jgi:hypothetical protein
MAEENESRTFMFDKVMRVMHRHTDGSVEEMRAEEHDPSFSDPERTWDTEGVNYHCSCGDSFYIQPGDTGTDNLIVMPPV